MSTYRKRMNSTGDDKYDFTSKKQGGTARAKNMIKRIQRASKNKRGK